MAEFEKALGLYAERNFKLEDAYSAFNKGARWAREWLMRNSIGEKRLFKEINNNKKLRTENQRLREALELAQKHAYFDKAQYKEQFEKALETGGDDGEV